MVIFRMLVKMLSNAQPKKVKALKRLFGLIHQSVADVNQFFTS